jgi:hypothetical protein
VPALAPTLPTSAEEGFMRLGMGQFTSEQGTSSIATQSVSEWIGGDVNFQLVEDAGTTVAVRVGKGHTVDAGIGRDVFGSKENVPA